MVILIKKENLKVSPIKYYHYIFDLYGCSLNKLNSVEFGLGILEEICKKASLNLVHTFKTSYYPTNGYSCIGIISESHISVHTWPEFSYCAVDIFICKGDIIAAEKALLTAFCPTKFKKKVIVRNTDFNSKAWMHSKIRQDHFEAYRCNKLLVRKKSKYQTIELFNNPSFNKILMLDGDIQVSTKDEGLYHEYLTHPVIRAHPHPRSVLILGGGDGGCLREIVKYKYLNKIVLVDIDKCVIDLSIKYLPEINNNSFNDSRVEIVFSDAAKYLGKSKFDIIISDLTAPIGPSVTAYKTLSKKLFGSLNEKGFISIHSGWWSSKVINDLPTQTLRQLSNVILHNLWIDSFACFWSFTVGWNHAVSAKEVLNRISKKTKINCSFFDVEKYLENIFLRY